MTYSQFTMIEKCLQERMPSCDGGRRVQDQLAWPGAVPQPCCSDGNTMKIFEAFG